MTHPADTVLSQLQAQSDRVIACIPWEEVPPGVSVFDKSECRYSRLLDSDSLGKKRYEHLPPGILAKGLLVSYQGLVVVVPYAYAEENWILALGDVVTLSWLRNTVRGLENSVPRNKDHTWKSMEMERLLGLLEWHKLVKKVSDNSILGDLRLLGLKDLPSGISMVNPEGGVFRVMGGMLGESGLVGYGWDIIEAEMTGADIERDWDINLDDDITVDWLRAEIDRMAGASGIVVSYENLPEGTCKIEFTGTYPWSGDADDYRDAVHTALIALVDRNT